jgi:hypothetical protein
VTRIFRTCRVAAACLTLLMMGLAGCSDKSANGGPADSAAAAAPADAPADAPAAASPDEVDSTGVRLMEGYPLTVLAGIERPGLELAQRVLKSNDEEVGKALQGVISRSQTWPVGIPVRVAFNGGSPALRRLIAEAAGEWGRITGLTLDFWTDASRTQFREWTPDDLTYEGDIRIGFERGANGGYWSMVGMAAVNPLQRRAGETSLNLERFDVQPPRDWRQVVLHEFGHAMGFQHEHQSPFSKCEEEFRWEDEPGYVPTPDPRLGGAFVRDANGKRPGIYRYLGGPPNMWPRDRVDYNLRRLAFDKELTASAFDSASIMKYYFDPDMFVRGRASSCFSAPNAVVSPTDRSLAAAIYSTAANATQASEAALVNAVERTTDSLRLSAVERTKVTREVVKLNRALRSTKRLFR